MTAALRIRLLEVPLDRDEGGYAYTAQLILQGVPPFERAYDMKMPGLYYVYTLMLLFFGQTVMGIHLGLLVLNSATIVLVCLIGKRLFNTTIGVTTAASYAVMSVSWTVEGFSANAEHLLLVPAMAGILLLLYSLDSSRLWCFLAGGLLLGTAFIIKHQGMFFGGFAAFYLLWHFLRKPKNQPHHSLRQYLVFLMGMAAPFSLLCLYFWAVGLFGKFWFWLFEYTREYASLVTFQQGVQGFIAQIAKMADSMILLWLLAVIGVISLLIRKDFRCRLDFMGLFLLFSFAALIPGYYFYSHYFILILPVVAVLIGLGTGAVADLLANGRPAIKMVVPVLLAAIAITYTIVAERVYLFQSTPTAISRNNFGTNPFVESVEIGNYIKNHSCPEDTIAVLGSEPQICFYSNRRSATSHLYIYPLMGTHKYAQSMQQEMTREIEVAKPKYIVLINVPFSWLVGPESEKYIFRWWERYCNYYDLMGLVEIFPDHTRYRWEKELTGLTSISSQNYVMVFNRRQN